MTPNQRFRKAKDALFSVALKYGRSMTEISADEHRPKDVAYRMSLARAYVTYRKALNKLKPPRV